METTENTFTDMEACLARFAEIGDGQTQISDQDALDGMPPSCVVKLFPELGNVVTGTYDDHEISTAMDYIKEGANASPDAKTSFSSAFNSMANPSEDWLDLVQGSPKESETPEYEPPEETPAFKAPTGGPGGM